MKILITILTGLMVLMGCSEKKSHIENSSFNEEIEYLIYLDSVLRDWPFPGAKGEYVPSRESLENSDTVVDGYGYNKAF